MSSSRLIPGLLLLALGLAGCGFKLSGATSLPEALASIYLVTDGFNEQQRAALRERLERAGTEISTGPVDDAVMLSVALTADPARTLVTSASTGKTVERVARRLDFSLKSAAGEMLIAPKTLVQQRDIVLDDDNLLSAGQEKASVARDLEQSLFNQLIHQLKRI